MQGDTHQIGEAVALGSCLKCHFIADFVLYKEDGVFLGAELRNHVCGVSVGAAAALYLRAMALAPDEGADATDYSGDKFYANNGAAERCAHRGGYWYLGTNAGVFCLRFGNARSYSDSSVGGRSAWYE